MRNTPKDCIQSVLGKIIDFVPERKNGTAHPKHTDMIYECDYGYAKGYIGGDGEPQDVYALNNASDKLEIIAVIERLDDNETKWVGVEPGTVMYEPYIKEQTQFCEKYFKSVYHCLYEKTCGSVVFTRENGVKKYLLIKNDSGHIGFPKGHIEYGENESQTAEREVFEETGITIKINPETRQEYTYTTLNKTIKNCVYFCNEFKTDNIKIQQEEISQSWLVPFDEAMLLLNFPQDRAVLEKADRMYD